MQDLVPCVLVTFDKEQIVVWRGKDNCSTNSKSDAQTFLTLVANSEDSTLEKSDTDILDEGSDDQSVVSDTSVSELIV